MPINPIQAKEAVQNGLCAVCATCANYWDARDRGVPDGRCLAVDGCGSPIAGDDFHEYSGPLNTGMDKICFVCGSPPALGVRARGKTRIVGICQTHLPLLKTLRPLNATRPVIGLPQVINGHGEIDLATFDKQHKPTLGQAIAEAETYFEEQAARGKKG
jgi:hypothetical protein